MKLQRLRDADRPRLTLIFEGTPLTACQGDTLMTALLAGGAGHLRRSEFDAEGKRAGFCLMGACQDCWVVVEGRGRVRSCATLAEDGMVVRRG